MAEKPNFQCYHHYTQGSLVGEGSWLSVSIQEALKIGKLVCTGKFEGECDSRVPVQKDLFSGQDIGCVGPSDPNCPDPGSAKIIQISEIKSL